LTVFALKFPSILNNWNTTLPS